MRLIPKNVNSIFIREYMRKDEWYIRNIREGSDIPHFPRGFLDYIETNAKKITYKINDSSIDGERAVVNVDFKYVDGAPLFKATFEEYMAEMFELALEDMEKEISEEDYSAAFMSAMENQSEIVEESFTEKTLDIDCIKIDGVWYIDDISDELLDVAITNMLSVGEELEESFDLEED